MTKTSLPLVNESSEPPRFWRSVEELNDVGVREVIEREFPEQAGFLIDEVSRRKFLTLMGASLALAGVGGCGGSVPDKIVPRVKQPENTIPGKPKYYATAMPMPGGATGLLVESHEGRPTKIEGNPDHPASLGACGVFEQASILGLYDPDRAKTVKHNGKIIGWDDALLELRKELEPIFAKEGEGLAILTGSINSPTLTVQIRELAKALPQAFWYSHDPSVTISTRHAAEIALEKAGLDLVYDIDKANVILSIGSDFLSRGPNHLRYAREFSRRRNPDSLMNRLYVVEAVPSPTGFVADHRLSINPTSSLDFVEQLALRLKAYAKGTIRKDQFIDNIATELESNGGRSLVIPGEFESPFVHLLIHAINSKLGNYGKTVFAIENHDWEFRDLRDLSREIERGQIKSIIILSCNPVYDAPMNLEFALKLEKVPLKIRLGLYEDETAAHCNWHVPETHFLEAWSDTQAVDGTATIIQPLIAPLYDGKSAHDLIAALLNIALEKPPTTKELGTSLSWNGREIIRAHWRGWHSEKKLSEPFERFWQKSLRDGVISGTQGIPVKAKLSENWDAAIKMESGRESSGGMELILRPDPTIFDGRFANNAWLQELPKPITKLVWENAAIMSPATAKELGIEMHEGPHGGSHGELITELVELTYRGRTVTVPAYILPGHADKCVTLHLGYGRTKAGRVGTGIGVNAYTLQTSDAPWGGPGLEIKRTGKSYTLACTQSQHSMHGRDLVRLATMAEFKKDPALTPKGGHHAAGGHNPHVEGFDHHPPEFYTNPQTKPPYQWGMSVDLGKCTGCHACVIACQAENSIPVVGKDQVTRGREMHWMRIDRYFTGDENNPQAVHQPVMCQHCENAPCEVVCPVEATTHSPDGLNEMTYNRCVGTRYCANNCPYKVRRFNFLEYTDYATESLKLQKNPDVSVRVRGVMEKCTYCVQRIREADITAKVQRRDIRDGDVVTACQQACPTQAIIFGNIIDKDSAVSQRKKLPRNYGILTELNTKPRTTYLAAVRNPNPELR